VLISPLEGGEWLTHAPAALPTGSNLGTHRTGGWMGARDGLDILEKSKKSCPWRDWNRRAGASKSSYPVNVTRFWQYCVDLGLRAIWQISRKTEILGNVCGVCARVTKPRTLPSANNKHLSTQCSLAEQVFQTISALAQPPACKERVVLTLCPSLLSLSLSCACEVHPSVY